MRNRDARGHEAAVWVRSLRASVARGWLVTCAIGAMTCGHALDVDDAGTASKRSPVGVSTEGAWALFDRSIDVGLEPPVAPVIAVLDGVEPVIAVKVYGPAPYVLSISGPATTPIGFDAIDLSKLSRGWHTFWASSPPSTAVVELRFTSTGSPGAVPELELWSEAEPPARVADLTAAALPDGYVASAAQPRVVIAPGLCTAFSVSLPRRVEQLQRVHLTYRATDLLREFVVTRSINGHAPHGGSWLPGAGTTNVVEQIDPRTLHAGSNDVSLCVPDTAVRGVTIEQLRLVGELDRGSRLATAITVGDRASGPLREGGRLGSGAPLLDGDVATTLEIAGGEVMTLSFDRLIAPDALSLVGQIGGPAVVTCVDLHGKHSTLASRAVGSALQLEGGSARCAALTVTFERASTLAEIDVVGSGAAERVDWPRLTVTSRREHFGEVAWIGGFVERPRAMTTAIRISVGGELVESRTGDFGRLVTRSSDVTTAWTVPVTAAFPDGTTQSQQVVLDHDRRDDLVAAQTASTRPGGSPTTHDRQFGREGDVAMSRATLLAATTLRLGTRVGLDVPAGAVGKATDVTVKHLGEGAVPPLDDGLVNVTGPRGHAYEFLPHGQKFARAIDVVLPYDPTLIPEGMTAADVHAYFYDPSLSRWVKLPRRALDVGERITRSATTHFTIMINAVLAVPKSPTPLSFDPTTLSSIAAASPAVNLDLIEPPTATSTGEARVALPLRIPAGRGRYSPSLALSYSSGGGNSWLGIGWDLTLSHITIDTRWGTPSYTPHGDRYLLDGAELVPTPETDGPACRSGGTGRRFRTRIEGGFAHIQRCDHVPGPAAASHYGFEIRDRDGTLYVYGVADAADPDADPRHTALTDPEAPHAIFRWNLREVVDVHGNTTTFSYDVADTGGPQPGRETYPSRIEYTSHGAAAAIYRVELLRDNGARRDRIISGRAGFKTVVGHLLRRVLVTAENQVVRDYVLTYARGQFDKTVLASVREFGTTGCDPSADAFALPACSGEFHQHTFDYVREVEGFEPPFVLGMEGPPEAQAAPLARGVSKAVSRSFDAGMSWGIQDGDVGAAVNASSGGSSDVGYRAEHVGTYDVDGNGVPDELYLTETGPKVLLNRASPAGFPSPLLVEQPFAIPGLTGMGEEQRIGFEVHTSTGGNVAYEDKLGFGHSVSAGWGNSISTARRFLTDLDGDGFVDYLSPATSDPRAALLGRRCPSGLCFSRTPFPAIRAIDPRSDPTVAQVRADVISRLVLGDPVLQWTAPFTGRVRIDASALKINPGGDDGVAVELFHQDVLISGASIAPGTTTPLVLAAGLELDVEQGEAIYVRIKTFADDGIGVDGTLQDLVDADLSIVYQRLGTGLGAEILLAPEVPRDPTGAGVYAFDGRRDFRLSGAPAALLVPAQGTLVLDAILTKRPGAADLRACVQRFAAPSSTATAFPSIDVPCTATASGDTTVTNVTGTLSLAAGSSAATPLPLSIAVEIGEILVLRVESDLSFDPDDVALEPAVVDRPLWSWSRLCELDEDLGVTCTTDPAKLAGEEVSEAAAFGPFVPRDPGTTAPRVPLVIATGEPTDVVTVNPLLGLTGEFLFAIRSDRQGVIEQFDCRHVSCPLITPASFSVTDGESISFEVVGSFGGSVTGSFGSGGTYSIAAIEHPTTPLVATVTPFVGGYHGFRAALWNEEEPFAPTSIVAEFGDLVTLDEERQLEIRRSVFSPSPSWGGDRRTGGARAWLGPSSNAYVAAGRFHASHLGLVADDAAFQQAGVIGAPVADVGGLFTGGYLRLSATSSKFIGTEAHLTIVNIANLSVDLTASRSDTTTTTDVVDLNGDGISDVIAGPASSFLGQVIDLALEQDPVVSGHAFDGGFRKRHAYNYALGLGAGAQLSPCTNAFGRPLLQCGAAKASNSSLGASTAIGWGINRSQTTDDLTDVNGDGLPDIVKRRGANIAIRLNLGNRFGDEEPFGTVADELRGPSDGFAINAEREAPVLGDALDSSASALTHESTVTQTRTRSFSAVVYSRSSTRRTSATRTTRQLADLNGDGLQDLLFKRDCDLASGNPLIGSCDPTIWVQYNRGGDFGGPVAWITPNWEAGGTPIALSPTFDPGITDLYMTGPDVLAGTGTDSSTSTRNGFGVNIPLPAGFSLNLSAGTTRSGDTDTYELALMDMDGDGAADHTLRRTTVGGTPTIYIKHNQITGQANLLRAVHRPLGGSFTLAYQRVGNTVDQPHSRHVLSRVVLDDGQDLGSAFASPNLVTMFDYAGGFHHRYEKEFFGFSRVTTRRADGVSVEDHYENRSYQVHGRLLQQRRRDSANNLLHCRDLTYTPNAVLDANGLPLGADPDCIAALHPLLGLDACVPAFVVMTEEATEQFEAGGSKRHVVRDLSRDRFGNVLASIDDGDDAITGDEVGAVASYHNDTAHWILGRSTALEVHGGGLAGPVLRRRTGSYDSSGDLTAVHVDTGAGMATTTLGHDAFGNLVHVTTPPNAANQPQTIDVEFDSIAHAFPTRITDGFGYTSTATYDLKFGAALVETDTQGAQLRRTLDTFGRLSTVRGPYDTTQAGISISYYPDEARPRAVTVTHASAPADYAGALPLALTTVTIVDGLGRPIQVRKTSVVNGGLGMTTAGLVARDLVGRTTTTYQPFFTPGAGVGFVAPQVTPQTSTVFDSQDRVVAIVHPDDADETTAYDLAEIPGGGPVLFRTTSIDANDHVRQTYADLLDRTRAFVEHPTPTTTSVTRYDYRPTGELRQIVDAEGNATTLGYDLRGLRTSLANADTGLIEERFDPMGNAIALVEPNHRAVGVEVRNVYDRDRLARIDYPSKTDVTFTYGAPGAPGFAAGRLTQVLDETGTQQHEYGAMGETRRTLRTVVDPGNPTHAAKLFDVRFTTDSLGRALRIQYPDGERVTHTYDAGGMLASVVGAGASWTQTYATDLRYDVFGNRIRAQFGNGAVSAWTFDPMRVRLTSAVTTLPSATRIQDLRYSYDPAGNPTTIANALGTRPANGHLPGDTAATFTYDGVDRLVRAVGTGSMSPSKTTSYDLQFAYTASHNLAHKRLAHVVANNGGGNPQNPAATNFASAYVYESGRPHLPSRVGDSALTYDPSGNLLARQTLSTGTVQSYVWDDDGRLVQVTGQGANQRNVYDAAGLRVLREGQGGVTIFASPLYDLNGTNAGQKHVFAGATRVATVLRSYTSTANPSLPTQPGTPFYFHADHLGSTGAVSRADGTLNDAHDYFPDGQAWIDSGPKNPVDGYLFNGKPLDVDTGFYDFGQRFYDPKLSLWLGVDPAFADDSSKTIGKPLMLAHGAFAAHSPERYVDPDGRVPIIIPAIIGLLAMESTLEQEGPSSAQLLTRAFTGVVGARLFLAAGPAGGFVTDKLVAAGAPRVAAVAAGGSTTGLLGTVGIDLARGEASSPGTYVASIALGGTLAVAGHAIKSKLASWIAKKLDRDTAVPVTRQISPYVGRSEKQINAMIGDQQRSLIKEFFGQNIAGASARAANFGVPQGLTKQSLEAYEELARRAVNRGADKAGVQAARLDLIRRAYEVLK